MDACSPAVVATGHRTAELIERLASGNLDSMIDGYRWMCQMVLEEELHFRRHGTYRLSAFEDANREVYSNAPLMERYMAGLLLSQVLWSNHLATFDFYVRKFCARLRPQSRHLEVGPGHGLLLYKVFEQGVSEIAGWDVSRASLGRSAACLESLGVTRPVLLEERNVFAPIGTQDMGRFDSIAISEVLEHVERPGDALTALRACLAPDGRIFVNAPVNAPAIDHIYHFREPEELLHLVRNAGFLVDDVIIAPATGYSEERARRLKVVMSVAIIARA
jgi:SAM-dependent methyltransferase